MRNCASKDRFFVLLNDPEKDINVLSMVRSHGFNEPKKVNSHDLSNFRESGKNLRKTPVWHFFVVSPIQSEKSRKPVPQGRQFKSFYEREKKQDRSTCSIFFYKDGSCKGNLDLIY